MCGRLGAHAQEWFSSVLTLDMELCMRHFTSLINLKADRLTRYAALGIGFATMSGSLASAGDGGCITFEPQGSTASNGLFNISHVEIKGSRSYVSNGFSGLQVLDISDQANPTEIGNVAVGSYFPILFDFALQDDMVFLAVSSNLSTSCGLFIVDMSDPASSTVIGTLDTFSMVEIEVVNDLAYVVSGFIVDPVLYIIDVSVPSSPALVSSTPLPGVPSTIQSAGLSIQGDIVYIDAENEGLLVYDTSDLSAPQLIGSNDNPGNASDLVVSGTTAYVADGLDGLKIFDVSDPTSPALIGSFATTDNLQEIELHGTTLYGLTRDFATSMVGNTGVFAWDVQNLGSITQLGSFHPAEMQSQGFNVDGNRLGIADGSTFDLLDIVNTCNSGCQADINGDGSLDFFDVSAFLQAFIAGDPIADITHDSIFDFHDISVFLGLYATGCP